MTFTITRQPSPDKFQFHIGAIRIRLPVKFLAGIDRFQFHIGAIRIKVEELCRHVLQCFNSILVQLEYVYKEAFTVPEGRFNSI